MVEVVNMRWQKKRKKKLRQDAGSERTVTRFLLFPKCIDYEYRWLETATWRQRLVLARSQYRDSIIKHNYLKWIDVYWDPTDVTNSEVFMGFNMKQG